MRLFCLLIFAVIAPLCWADENISLICKFKTIGEEEYSFNATLVLNVVRSGRTATIRVPTEQGLRDSLELQAKDGQFSIPKSALFLPQEGEAALTCIVYSSGRIPIVYQPLVDPKSDAIRIEQWMWERSRYRVQASPTLPSAAQELRRAAAYLDPTKHAELIQQLEDDAKEEDAIAQRQMSLLLPAYIYPPDAGTLADKKNVLAQLNAKDWKAIETDLRTLAEGGIESWVIVSPPVSAGSKVNEQYADKIRMLSRVKSNPVGYVSLGKGDGPARVYESVQSVESQLENWVRLYPSVKGFFLDTCPTDEGHFADVERIAKIAKSLLPNGKVFINPGTVPHKDYLNSALIDVICVETNLGANAIAEVKESKPKLAAILWNNSQPESEISTVRSLGYEYVYVTDRNDQIDLDGVKGMDDNGRWGRLPTQANWKKMLSALYRTKNQIPPKAGTPAPQRR